MLICQDLRTSNGCGATNPDGTVRCASCGQLLRYALHLHEPGTLIAGYRVLRTIGHGGFGAVYAVAERLAPGRPLALKETFDTVSIAAFQREFATLSQLEHPHLPSYHAVFEHDGNGYLVMELIPGQSLQDVLEMQPGPLPEAQVLGYAVQLCDVLSFLHAQQPPILHRDVKPANARLTPEGRIKLVDFGLHKQAGQHTRASVRGVGTPGYAPIEQYGTARERTDPRSEVYSLGATLYHLLTGSEPPPATERIAADEDPLVAPRRLNRAISEHVSAAVVRAMGLIQRERFLSVAELRHALLAQPPTAPPIPPRSRKPASTPLRPPGAERLAATLQGPSEAVRDVAWAPDGRNLVGASGQRLFVWSASIHRLIETIAGPRETVTSVDWSDAGDTLICATWDGLVSARGDSDERTSPIGEHSGPATCVRFSPDGTLAASGGWDEALRLWDVERRESLGSIGSEGGRVSALAWSPDGRSVAAATLDGGVRIWAADDGRLLHRLAGHAGGARCLAWSPDGRMLASGGDDRRVVVWSLVDGRPIDSAEAHGSMVASLAWSPEGRMLASGGMDNLIRLWGLSPDGALRALADLPGHSGCVWGLAFSPDARSLASASGDWTAKLWRV